MDGWRKTNKVGEVLIVPIQVPRGDKAGRVLISTNVPMVDKAGCTTIGCSFGMPASPVHQPASPLH